DTERPRRPVKDGAYLALAALARVLQTRTSPAWARELALELLEGTGHAALDRGALGGWLLEGRAGSAAEASAAAALAPRVAAALAKGEVTLEGAVAAGLALVDVGRHAEAL